VFSVCLVRLVHITLVHITLLYRRFEKCVKKSDSLRVRSTNAIERAFREVRRRTRPMTCFTNDASCDRITYAVVHYLNEQWQGRPLW